MLVTALKSFRTGHLDDTVEKGDNFYVSDLLGEAMISLKQVKLAPASAKQCTAKAAAKAKAVADAQAAALAAEEKAQADAAIAALADAAAKEALAVQAAADAAALEAEKTT